MNETMTAAEALQATINILIGICVPMAYKEQIADPLGCAISNLIVIRNAMTANEKKE